MGYQDHITWAWHNPGPPSGPMGGQCSAVVIDGTQRGNKSAHECVAECIHVWVKSQNSKTALEWLTKGAQCHDKEAQKELNAAGTNAVKYAVETYGPLLNLGDLKLGAFGKAASASKGKAAKTEKAAAAKTSAPAKAPAAPKTAAPAKAAPTKKAEPTPKAAKAPAKAPVAPKAAVSKAATPAKAPATAKPAAAGKAAPKKGK